MFARNLLQAGEFVTLVPVGLPITLQYNDKGAIQKIWLGHEDDTLEDVSDIFLQPVIKHKQVPIKISVKGGTSYVKGVFYTSSIYADGGSLPECVQESLIRAYEIDPTAFTFYAGEVSSLSTTFRGAVPIRQWLALAGFNILPGYVVPADLTEVKFEQMVAKNYPFQYPLISSYILYHRDGSTSYPKTGLTQFVANKILRTVDEYGNIRANVVDSSDGSIHQVPYAYVVKLNINVNTLIVKNSDSEFIFSTTTDSVKRDKRSSKIQCSCCGRNLIVPSDVHAIFRCSDPHCNSVLYPRVTRMLIKLGLPTITYSVYKEYADKVGNIFTLIDIFDMDQYKDAEIDVSIADVVRAIVPRDVLPGDTQIAQLVDECSNSVDTLIYYMSNVDKMKTDLVLDPHAFQRFYVWIAQPENLSDVRELFKLKNIHIHSDRRLFDGPPIFRGKTIVLTGTFTHGSIDEVSNIVKSYSAQTSKTLSDDCDLVLVGDIHENVNGHIIRTAQKYRIPVMKESDFFAQYEIDKDMAENL